MSIRVPLLPEPTVRKRHTSNWRFDPDLVRVCHQHYNVLDVWAQRGVVRPSGHVPAARSGLSNPVSAASYARRRKKAVSYCGLCGERKDSGNTVQRTPLSKQRNKHLQTTWIEAAKMAPRYSPTLALLYDREKQRGNANRATLAVARNWWPISWPWIPGKRISWWWTGKPTPLPRLGPKSFFSANLPGLAVNPTGHEGQARDAPKRDQSEQVFVASFCRMYDMY